MIEVTRTVEIEAPVETVWATVAKLDSVEQWLDAVSKATYNSEQTSGVGAGRTCVIKGFGTLVETVVEWKENDTYTLDVEGTPFIMKTFNGTWKLEDAGGGRTRTTTTLRAQAAFGPLAGALEKFLLRPQLEKDVASAQRQLKSFIEAAEQRQAA